MSKKTKKTSKKYYFLLPVIAILLAVGIAADILIPSYKQVISGAITEQPRANEEYIAAALDNSRQANIRLEEEGAVLMKNEGALPLTAKDTKVNVYGILSAHHYVGGSGSGSTGAAGVDLKTALESVGYTVNPTLWTLIESSPLSWDSGSTVGNKIAGQYELEIAKYEAAQSFADAKAYSDYAIVTFGTNGGEGDDGDRGEVNSLELGENEKALLERLDQEGFTVIALINSSYVMELGPVMQHADAILWIGGTGLYGTYGVADILCGQANPSGRLVDTWMYEQETSSTYYTTINANSLYVDEAGKTLGAYTNYNEGIYVGYRWYETADAEGYWDTVSNEYGAGYEGVVAYPFGYGLSYTSFTEEITKTSYENGLFTFIVKAKNTGSVPGKDVIELYVEKPYVNGGLEMPKVALAAFAKTGELKAGAEETLTLTVTEEDLACYDVAADGGSGAYVLPGGDYAFYLASAKTGAHAWKVYASDASRTAQFAVSEIVYTGENKRSTDTVQASNRLEVTDNDTGIASNDATAGFRQLSRKDGFANAEETISRAANENGNVVLTENDALYTVLLNTYGKKTYVNYNVEHLAQVAEIESAALNQEKQYTLADLYTTDANGNPLYRDDSRTESRIVLKPVDYDDPRWDVLLSQMSAEELEELIGRGGYGTIAIESIEKQAAVDYDGPTGFANFLKASLNIPQETTGFCSEPIMAATWNTELLEEYGQAVAKEGNAFGNNGWYAPGMNIHRTPFEGRTGEYFSEDPFITGKMGGAVAAGAFSKGVYTYAKHFAFNEIETLRNGGMNCWMSEQAAREIYLKPFEIGIKDGGINGLMTSFMYMNGQWNGADFNLVSGIVRGEWNFKGVMNTDLAGPATMGAIRALCGGVDMLLGTSFGKNQTLAWVRCDGVKETDEGIRAMKTAAKHILYAYASASLNREVMVKAADGAQWMDIAFIALNVLVYAGAALLLFLFIRKHIQYKRLSKTNFAVVDADDPVVAGQTEKGENA